MSGRRELTRNQKVDAAVHDEILTRQRVDRLERDYSRLIEVMQHTYAFVGRGFLGRLRWLFTGK